MGFIPDIEKISSWLPFSRQNLLFSATMPDEIRNLVRNIAPIASEVKASPPSSTSQNIEQFFVKAPSDAKSKREKLREIIKEESEIQNAIIFCNRKRDVATLARSMQRHEVNAAGLHGDMAQSERLEVLNQFKSGDVQFLIASDVAARGLDIASVSHVFNFDIPTHAEDYVHRIGRTGRAGRKGKSFTFVGKIEQKYVDAIEQNSKIEIVWHNLSKQDASVEGVVKQKNSSPSKGKNAKLPQNKPTSRYDSQKGIGEMNMMKGTILGFGEHVPAFFEI